MDTGRDQFQLQAVYGHRLSLCVRTLCGRNHPRVQKEAGVQQSVCDYAERVEVLRGTTQKEKLPVDHEGLRRYAFSVGTM